MMHASQNTKTGSAKKTLNKKHGKLKRTILTILVSLGIVIAATAAVGFWYVEKPVKQEKQDVTIESWNSSSEK